MTRHPAAILSLALLLVLGAATTATAQPGPQVAERLPEPSPDQSAIHHPQVVGWGEREMPTPPEGFEVTAFVRGIENPRWLYVLPSGDVLVAQSRTLPKPAKPAASPAEEQQKQRMRAGLRQSKTVTGDSPNKVTLLRDADHDGAAELQEQFLGELNQPFGMVLVGDRLFVACTDAVLSYPYQPGQTRITASPLTIAHLPAGGFNNHWTRNIVANREGTKLYVSVGSASNVAEHGMQEEILRAAILEMNLDGTQLTVFASGLRNPVGMAWHPTTGALWTAVNERDKLGDELVPDYLTRVQRGAFYGWPYSYFGSHADPRRVGERPDLVQKAVIPDLALGAHTASLGLAFYDGEQFPERYRGGAFVGQRGSWNRSQFAGYKVVFAPFRDGEPTGEVEDFLTGFILDNERVHGRPVGVAVAQDGTLLVADEPGNVIWRVRKK